MTTRSIKQTEADTCRTRITPQLREAGREEPPHLLDWQDRKETPQAWQLAADQLLAGNANLDQKNPHAKVGMDHDHPKDLIANMRSHENEVMHLLGEIEALVSEMEQ
jgi:hypothetical protein